MYTYNLVSTFQGDKNGESIIILYHSRNETDWRF